MTADVQKQMLRTEFKQQENRMALTCGITAVVKHRVSIIHRLISFAAALLSPFFCSGNKLENQFIFSLPNFYKHMGKHLGW